MKNLLKVALLPVLASALLLSACDKGDKKADDKKGDDTAAKTTDSEAAATKPAEPTATATMTKEQAGDAMVAMMEKLATAAEANKGDCDKTADEFTAIMDKNKPLMEASKKLDADPANKEWFEANYGAKMEAPMKKMMPALMECQGNKKLEEAFASFE